MEPTKHRTSEATARLDPSLRGFNLEATCKGPREPNPPSDTWWFHRHGNILRTGLLILIECVCVCVYVYVYMYIYIYIRNHI